MEFPEGSGNIDRQQPGYPQGLFSCRIAASVFPVCNWICLISKPPGKRPLRTPTSTPLQADHRPDHKHPVATNLLAQDFSASRRDEAWVGDITYIWTLEGWVYLAVLLDLYSRRVVGWAMRKLLNRELAIAALNQAVLRREPPPGLVHHTDRGCQYASGDYQKLLDRHGMKCSMSAAGCCWDNAVAESFFATLKKELVRGYAFFTRTEAYGTVSDYIENYYNAKRRHSANGQVSPTSQQKNASNFLGALGALTIGNDDRRIYVGNEYERHDQAGQITEVYKVFGRSSQPPGVITYPAYLPRWMCFSARRSCGLKSASTPEPKAGAECGSSARICAGGGPRQC